LNKLCCFVDNFFLFLRKLLIIIFLVQIQICFLISGKFCQIIWYHKIKKTKIFYNAIKYFGVGCVFLVFFFWGLGVGCCFEEVYSKVMWSPLRKACMQCLFMCLWMSSNQVLFISKKRKFYSCMFCSKLKKKKLGFFLIR